MAKKKKKKSRVKNGNEKQKPSQTLNSTNKHISYSHFLITGSKKKIKEKKWAKV